ncbi:hypothetical protein ZEAMMB73_Zm00001d023671 [Zea mays]|uniref:Uncharacterized protein n=1 Tax=Zea mays TaxID=4577 RepID=A0A1D6IUR8_MAIZE|nr:hypothetical protein ZEAMMB73_Zm00001d023671 [Zea mays]
MAGGGMVGGAFWATRALEVVKRNDSPGLLWKRIKLTTTRKNNAKKRLKRLWQQVSVDALELDAAAYEHGDDAKEEVDDVLACPCDDRTTIWTSLAMSS